MDLSKADGSAVTNSKQWERYFSQFLNSIQSDLSTRELRRGKQEVTHVFDGSVLSDERILIASGSLLTESPPSRDDMAKVRLI